MRKSYTSQLTDYVKQNHRNSSTHYCCDERLKKDGGNSKCCACYPHDGCKA